MQNLVRMMDADGTLCVIAADTTETVREMHRLHGTAKVVSAALGRLLTAASLMGSMLKGEKDSITLKVSADGAASPPYPTATAMCAAMRGETMWFYR